MILVKHTKGEKSLNNTGEKDSHKIIWFFVIICIFGLIL